MSRLATTSSLTTSSGWPPSATAPTASSFWKGAPILSTSTRSSGACKARAISKPTGTPPRGSASTTGFSSFRISRRSASCRPASCLSANIVCHLRHRHRQMGQEPVLGQCHDGFQRPGLPEQMRCTGNDFQPAFAAQGMVCILVERQHLRIAAADDQQGGGGNRGERRAGQVRPTAAADDGGDVGADGGGGEGRGGAGAGAEKAKRKLQIRRGATRPGGRLVKPVRQQRN